MPLFNILAGLDAAIASLEAVTGETVTIEGITCACTRSSDPEDQQTFEDGGTVFKRTASINVRKSLLGKANFFLDVGQSASYLGQSYRILNIHDSAAYWKVDLLQSEA